MAEKPLRLLVAGISWPPETFLARLIRGLVEAGVDVTIACERRPSAEWLVDAEIHWLHTHAWGGSHHLRLMRLAWMAATASLRAPSDVRQFAFHVRKAPNLVERLRSWNRLLPYAGKSWDVIYFPWNSAAIAHLPLYGLGIPVVVSCRGSQVNVAPHDSHRSTIKEGLQTTFRRAAAVHCVSEAIKQKAMQYGLDPKKAWVIRPAVDSEFFRPSEQRAARKHEFRVVTTASLVWCKGYEYALLAIKQLLADGVPVQFDIIGDGIERQRIIYTIHDLGLTQHVRLHGRLSPDKVRDRLWGADAFLLASVSEGISNAVLEAMSCGLPVITTDCGGMREAVTDGVEGFVTGVRDPEAIAAALRKLWQNRDLRTRMGEAARARVLADFTSEKQTQAFLEMYASVCSGSRTFDH